MKKRWTFIGAATLLAGMLTVGAGQALADGFTTFSIGTTFGGGGHHHGGRYFDDDDYGRHYRGYGHGYDRGHYRHGSRSHVSIGFSTIFTGNPYYSGYYSSPYAYSPNSYYPYAVPRQPVYIAPPTYYAPPSYNNGYPQNSYTPPAYNNGYRQSSYTAPPADSCLQTREYQTRIKVGGHNVPGYGTACLQPDGSWKEGPAQPEQ